MDIKLQIKFFFLIILLVNSMFARTCNVHNDIMKSILMIESHTNKKIGYEYLISFNNSCEAKKYREIYKELFLDSRTIDCKNKHTCEKILKELIGNEIVNLDLGAYQLNYIHQKIPHKSHYFSFIDSYYKACSYVEKNIKEFGYTWYAIAAYHSKTKSLNDIYRQKLITNYQKLQIMNKH